MYIYIYIYIHMCIHIHICMCVKERMSLSNAIQRRTGRGQRGGAATSYQSCLFVCVFFI